jgi:tetratricopeptide (TPR) repeat protein
VIWASTFWGVSRQSRAGEPFAVPGDAHGGERERLTGDLGDHRGARARGGVSRAFVMSNRVLPGRVACQRGAWLDGHRLLTDADRTTPLGRGDLELLATSAYLIGRDEEFHDVLERAHRAHIEADDPCRAARCGFWIGLTLLFRGETARGSGWLARAQRLIAGRDCPEQGYLLLPSAEEHLGAGNPGAALAAASRAADIGDRFRDADISACARHLQGRAPIQRQEVRAGLALLDEAMVSATAGELTPIMTGLIYCSVIAACQSVCALGRARQWTELMTTWCERQPQTNAFRGKCLVCRVEILQSSGAWSEAMAEAARACERLSHDGNRAWAAPAVSQQGDLHRLRGEFAEAEEAYRSAARLGWEPQPGLALLRLAQGRTVTGLAALGRVLGTTTDPFARARLLPAQVEIAIAAQELLEARKACDELEEIASRSEMDGLLATAAQARGTLELAQGNARAALGYLSRALEAWRELEVPYEAARVRVLLGLACGAIRDREAYELQLDAAGEVFEELGARADLAHLETLEAPARAAAPHPGCARRPLSSGCRTSRTMRRLPGCGSTASLPRRYPSSRACRAGPRRPRPGRPIS